jgi:sugar/nucleoside kinase (ribokinase family)
VPIPLRLSFPHDRDFDVTGLGQNSVDLVARVSTFPAPNSKQRLQGLVWLPGGQVASALVCCARLGWRTRYIGRFGSDELGQVGRDSLTAEGVDLSASSVIEGVRTRAAIVLVHEVTGERTVLWDRDPRLALRPSDVPGHVLARTRIVLVDAEDVQASIHAARIARASGAVTVVDVEAVEPGVEELLAAIDVIIVSEGFPEQLTGMADTSAALKELVRRFKPAVACVTLGARGCLGCTDAGEVAAPAFPIDCVDSTGAGDAFRGGFISALLEAKGDTTLDDVLRRANAVAALACRRAGARDGLPRRDEVARLLQEASGPVVH